MLINKQNINEKPLERDDLPASTPSQESLIQINYNEKIYLEKESSVKSFIPFLLLFGVAVTQLWSEAENAVCKACHPIIYQEYRDSIHSRSSIYTDPVHKAVWDLHPGKVKGKYSCGKCHTPADHRLIEGKSGLTDNFIQRTEPISCQQCHKIESIEKHARSNKNILTDKKKYFFSADSQKRGTKVHFKEKSSFLGLFTRTSGSPYHDIDYSNEIYYNGTICLGCHSHKQNGKGFTVCDLEVKQGDSKESCISCHMPKIQGPLANQKGHGRHASHAINIHGGHLNQLSKYIHLSISEKSDGFTVTLRNEATHTLFPQPLRLGQLRVEIEREGKRVKLKTYTFARVIGRGGKPAMPWLADSVLSDTTLKALESRTLDYDFKIQKGDAVTVTFGYYLVKPGAAKKLKISDKSATDFIILKRKRFSFPDKAE